MNNDIENSNSEYWKQKYLKYKAKYMNLDTKTGGRHHSSHRRSNSYSRQQFNPFMQQPGFNPFFQQPVAIGPNGVMTSGLMGPGMMGPGMVGPGGLMVGPSGIMSPGGIIQPGLSSPGFIMTPRGLVPFFKMNPPAVTPVITDAIYEAVGTYIKINNSIYLNLKNTAGEVLVKTVEHNNWLKIPITIGSTDYIKQMKTGLDTLLLGAVISETDIGNKMKYNTKDGHVSFNIKIGESPPTGYKFVTESGVTVYS